MSELSTMTMSPQAHPDRARRQRFQELFADHGLRCTRQRVAIYDALRGDTSHPTIDELYRQVSETVPGLSLATVYNTVEAFCQAGLAQRLTGGKPDGNGLNARYDATVDNHIHLRDRETGEVTDAPEAISRKLLAQIPQDVLDRLETETGFRVEDVQIEIVGSHTDSRARRRD